MFCGAGILIAHLAVLFSLPPVLLKAGAVLCKSTAPLLSGFACESVDVKVDAFVLLDISPESSTNCMLKLPKTRNGTIALFSQVHRTCPHCRARRSRCGDSCAIPDCVCARPNVLYDRTIAYTPICLHLFVYHVTPTHVHTLVRSNFYTRRFLHTYTHHYPTRVPFRMIYDVFWPLAFRTRFKHGLRATPICGSRIRGWPRGESCVTADLL